jgi:hypothetical protein
MTTTRKEIIVEGSDDGKTWIPYTFYFKPGAPNRTLPVVAPFQPRLDWQMWFAALGSQSDSPWFTRFVIRLLRGSKGVEALLQSTPFTHPPRYIRAELYDYKFANISENAKDGSVWSRSREGLFFPISTMRDSLR